MTLPRTRVSLAAEQNFRDRLAELGAVLLEPEWLGSKGKHHVRCVAGHDCYPVPNCVQQGQGVCRTCCGHDPEAAWAAFRKRLAELGAELLEMKWLGNAHRYHVRCSAGHDCYPMPNTVQQGGGICRTCAGLDPATAEAAFRARLAELGAVLLEPYINSSSRHRVRCAAGHDCDPWPDGLRQGRGPCRICAKRDPQTTEAAFRNRLAELGATPLYGEYQGNKHRHHVRCQNGHDCYPRPNDVLSGDGICRMCAGKRWDVFYVVTSADGVKFGVTSGSPQRRLRNHAARGYTEVARLVTGLPGTVAPDTETAIVAALALAGEKPIRGREYFALDCLALILDVADSWLAAEVSAAA